MIYSHNKEVLGKLRDIISLKQEKENIQELGCLHFPIAHIPSGSYTLFQH